MVERCARWPLAIALIAGLALLVACGGAPLKVDPIDRNQDPAEAVGQLAEGLAQARTDQVDVLSPNWFKKAEASHAAAKQALDGNAPAERILETAALGQAELKQAEVIAIRSRDQLEQAIRSRAAARAVNAQQFAEEYAAIENAFLGLTRSVENSDFERARRGSRKVSERYRELELRAITLAATGDVRHLLQNALEAKVPEMAPKAFEQARESLTQAETYIAEQRYDQATILQKSDQARFLVQRAVVIAGTSRMLAQMTPEDIALWMESFLFQTTTHLQSADRRNLSFEEQLGAILSSVDTLQAERTLARRSADEKSVLIEKLGERLAELEGTHQQIRQDKQRLAAENRYHALFETVRQGFEPEEAEVIKEADQLILRLTGIRFRVGSADIPPDSHGLLSKVQQVIQFFGQPDVIVEGHSDSSGSQEMNRALSQRRAESVKKFLVDRYTLPTTKVSAIGHGSTRPVVSNASAAGRARNRRIDVIIKPTGQAMP